MGILKDNYIYRYFIVSIFSVCGNSMLEIMCYMEPVPSVRLLQAVISLPFQSVFILLYPHFLDLFDILKFIVNIFIAFLSDKSLFVLTFPLSTLMII